MTFFLHLQLLALIAPAILYAHLGASPEECKRIYGEPKFTEERDGHIGKGYQPAFADFGGAIVIASFKSEKVVSIRYKIAGKTEFTVSQLALITSLNGLMVGKKFVEIGLSPDRTKRLWATEDNAAYMVVTVGSAIVDLMTQAEAIDTIRQLPTPTKNGLPVSKLPTVDLSSATIGSSPQFIPVKLAHGVSMELPKSWWLIGKDFNDLIQTSTQSVLDLSGVEKSLDTEVVLVTANSMPKTTYASVRATFSTPPVATPEELAKITPADLSELTVQMEQLIKRMMGQSANKLVEFQGCSLTKVGECPSMLTRYRRTGPHGDVLVESHQIATHEGTVNLTLSYRVSEAALWKAVIERIEKSVVIMK